MKIVMSQRNISNYLREQRKVCSIKNKKTALLKYWFLGEISTWESAVKAMFSHYQLNHRASFTSKYSKLYFLFRNVKMA